jgi:dTDP-4-amino-4,6-dideoxygalactose transaminase
MKYPVAKPSIDGNELKYLTECIEKGEISSKGAFVTRFEVAFAEYIGTKYAVACSSGTAALQLACWAIGIKEGDEVIVPSFTMIASAWGVTHAGGTPVFVDCGSDLNIDVTKIEAAITPRTKAIMPVHIYGRPCAMGPILQLAHDYNLMVIEDAAEAHGATVNGEKVGSIGDMGCFSLFGNKIISAGEGGVITTNDPRLYEQLCHLRSMGFDPDHTFLHRKTAHNFRMTNMQAAVALAQLERIDEFLAKRKQIQKWYDERLNPKAVRNEGEVCWMYDVVIEKAGETATPISVVRDALIAHLEKNGIESRRYFKPMGEQPCLKNVSRWFDEKQTDCPRAKDFSERGLYLPTYTALTESDIDEICNVVKSFFYDKTGAGKGADGDSTKGSADVGAPGAIPSETGTSGVGEADGGAGAGGDAGNNSNDKEVV